ncbi:adenylyltransferase/sulfurtransferase [Paenibacillus phyllosphaerae]|uniref:Adenylyltransferase/sulfurtransferase n=1 Tax=Paenibacillus phyllosphaerae TaxID=274593 RepID=A0A7W5B3H7_9BACL|nr:ThiF family adenylyltransferase [Paenibacillus phyllosphaerae]MBB3113648.1 adenylyltransferase/sulfurtransferase [Paenibacillus phyllosphaerae]
MPNEARSTSPAPAPKWPDRYSRQTRFAPIGTAGQRKIGEAAVLIVGCGALGASLAQHMVRAGVGLVRIVDRDYVEPSNLQRQMLFDEADALASWPKAVAAANKLARINSEIRIEPHVLDVTAANVQAITADVDLVLDGTDNAAVRLLLSDQCFLRGIPFLYGGVTGAIGMSAMLLPGETACLRCLIGGDEDGEAVDSCDTIGVISPAVEWVAAIQAAEAFKWLTGNKEARRRTWLTADLWNYRTTEAALPGPTGSCRICGDRHADQQRKPTESSYAAIPTVESHEPVYAAALCGRDTVQVTMGFAITLEQAHKKLAALGCEVSANPYLVRAQLEEGGRLVLFPDGRVLVQGTQDPERAVQLCSQYISKMEQGGQPLEWANRT